MIQETKRLYQAWPDVSDEKDLQLNPLYEAWHDARDRGCTTPGTSREGLKQQALFIRDPVDEQFRSGSLEWTRPKAPWPRCVDTLVSAVMEQAL